MALGASQPATINDGSGAVVNARFLARPHSGVSRVGAELLRALAEELAQEGRASRVRVAVPTSVVSPLGATAAVQCTRGFASNLGTQLLLPMLYRGATVISFCNETPLLAASSVVWIHDTNIFDAPESYPRTYKLWHRAVLEAAKLRRFQIVTVSEDARRRLIARGVKPERICVIYNGGDHILRAAAEPNVLDKVGLGSTRYLLLVGSPARHKNVPFAMKVLLPLCHEGLKLAVLGLSQVGPYSDAGELQRDPRIVVLPRVSDGELRALYHAASAVVSPSLCEGFGLYAAEAMFAESGPLVLSQRGALPEVGGDAALYFDPTNPEALRESVQLALQTSTAEHLRSSARIQREKFRWRRAARQVIDGFLS